MTQNDNAPKQHATIESWLADSRFTEEEAEQQAARLVAQGALREAQSCLLDAIRVPSLDDETANALQIGLKRLRDCEQLVSHTLYFDRQVALSEANPNLGARRIPVTVIGTPGDGTVEFVEADLPEDLQREIAQAIAGRRAKPVPNA